MNGSIVTDSIKTAWMRTRTLLLTDVDVSRWLKYGLIAMIGAATVGGGANLNFQFPMGSTPGDRGEWSGPGGVGPEVADALLGALSWLSGNIANLIILTVGLITVWIVLWLVVLYIKSVFRFIFVEAIAAEREPNIGDAWRRHRGAGLALLLWNLLLALVPLLLMLVALVPIFSSIGLLISGEPRSAVLGIGGLIGLLGLILFGALLLVVGRALTDDFLVPAMYARRCGVFAGWRHIKRAWQGQLGNVIFFYLLKLLLAIGAGIVVAIVGLLAGVLLVLPALSITAVVVLIALSGIAPAPAVLIFGGPALLTIVLGGAVFVYIINVVLLPVRVLLQAYSLAFAGRLDTLLRTI